MDYNGKRIVFIDFETFFDRKISYDLKSLSITEYVQDRRFWILGMAYKFKDDEKTHWLAGQHTIEAWISTADWKNTVVVAHNIKFDGAILSWHFGIKPFAWMDTVGLAKAILGENIPGYSLKRLSIYLGLPPKGNISCEGILHPSQEQLAELGKYCKNDVNICEAIYEKLMPQFPQGQLAAMDWTIRAFVEPKLCLDQECLRRGVENEKKRREEIIKKSGVDKSVLSSNKQFAELLQQRGYEVPTKTSGRTGKQIPAFAKTDDGLSNLRRTWPALYDARIASKANLLETRGESLLAVAKTGLFPFDVNFSGATQTHRYSGGSGAGGNPQNFTRQSFLREAVGASPGYSLVVGDFAAIELRILAWLANEPKLIDKLLKDEDVYADFASTKYGRKITKADKAERQYGKESILGLGYQMGPTKFKARIKTVMGVDITDDEAWGTVKLYRDTYPNVPKRWEQAHDLLPLIASGDIGCVWFAPFIKVRQNTLILPSGLEIKYPNLRPVTVQGRRGPKIEWIYDVYTKTDESEPTKLYGGKVIENICQALAGELCKEAIARAENAGLWCAGQLHDEVLAISKEPLVGVKILRAAMEVSPIWMPLLRLKAEVGCGSNWGSAKI